MQLLGEQTLVDTAVSLGVQGFDTLLLKPG